MARQNSSRLTRFGAAALGLGALAAPQLMQASPAAAQSWEPTRPIQFIIPAGTGGGADQMARFIQGVVAKHNLSKQPIVTLEDGRKALALALEIQKQMDDHRRRSHLDELLKKYPAKVPDGD